MSGGYTIILAVSLIVCVPIWTALFFGLRKFSPVKRILGSYLILAAIIYIAQLFPLPGIYLMFMVGALWVSVILNVMLLHVTNAAVIGKIPRSWLILPGIVYGAWAVFAGAHEIYLASKIHKLEALNHIDVAVPGDLDLLFDPAPGSSFQKDDLAVEVKKYVVGGRVFLGDYELQVFQSEERGARRCVEQINTEIGERSYGTFRALPGYDKQTNCLIARHNPGPHSGLHFRRIADDGTGRGKSDNAAHSIEIVSGDGTTKRVGYFGYGQVATISPLPLFWFGCSLNSGAAKWQCFFGPMSRSVHYGVSRTPRTLEHGEVRAMALGKLLDRPTREKSYGFRAPRRYDVHPD